MATSGIHGYTDRISVAPGERIRFMLSCEDVDTYRADIVRLIHGDTNPAGPGFKEELIDSPVSGDYQGRFQPIRPGSHVVVTDHRTARLSFSGAFTLHAFIMPMTPAKDAQGIMTRWSAANSSGYALVIEDGGRLGLWVGDGEGRTVRIKSDVPMMPWVWYSVAAAYDPAAGRAVLHQEPIVNSTNGLLGRAHLNRSSSLVEISVASVKDGGHGPFIMGGYATTTPSGETIVAGHYNGRIDRPRVYARALGRSELLSLAEGVPAAAQGLTAAWDFATVSGHTESQPTG